MLGSPLPKKLFLSQQVRDIDHSAINIHGIEGFALMSKAAQFSFEVLLEQFPNTKHLSVLCGSGNNAGDGYIVAALAQQHGIETIVYYLSPPDKLIGDAMKAYQLCKQAKVSCEEYTESSLMNHVEKHVIIDSLLGTGLNAPVRGSYASAIHSANKCNAPILSIDIPSGLNANTGSIMGCAIEAHSTATFIALKLGLFTGEGRSNTGELFYDSLDINDAIIDEQTPVAKKLSLATLLENVTHRPRHFHKGNCGHTLIIGGEQGYGGAVMMAAQAALRCGSGLTSVITHNDNCPALLARSPEIMATPSNSIEKVNQLIEAASVIVIGPGLAQTAWSEKMLQKVISLDKPVVLDADALNILSRKPNWLLSISNEIRNKRVYTPHPGEAARLLSIDSSQLIQTERLKAIRDLQTLLGGHILLKGSGSLIISPENNVSLCPYGNPGMASGGMGDVLSGVIGGLIAQGFELGFALKLATSLHAYAADIETKESGERGLCATDLIPTIRKSLNKLDAKSDG